MSAIAAKAILAGGCLCGAVRFESTAKPIDTGYCHCRMCQKLSGAPVLSWASFDLEHFQYTKGAPQVYVSSSYGQREFCAACGSQIAFRDNQRQGTIEINVGTMEEPERMKPEYHIWCSSRIDWFDTNDNLPRHAESAPSGPATETR
jgi:hypothetical protein